jgi:predicted PurR-regulated permease PerM
MASPPRTASVSTVALWVLAVLAAIFFLRAASSFLIPIALGVLISYPLEPVVAWLERHRVPRGAGAALLLLALLGAGAAGMYTLRDDVKQLLQQLPRAAERAREMVASQIGIDGDAVQQATGGAVQDRETDSSGAAGEQGAIASIGQMSGSLLQLGATTLMALAGHLVVIVFLVFFLLVSGDHFRKRIVEISGPDPEDRKVAATIIRDIHQQIQRYLLVLLITGLIVSAATWTVLAWMNVPNAIMWAFLAGAFNSIPYFGPVVVSGGLFVVGMVQGGLTQALQMGGATLLITSLEGWLITPPLMGKAERMSALAVFIGLLLWTWVWGAWGTLLAVPMLVIIKSVADHIPRLRPLGRLMAP